MSVLQSSVDWVLTQARVRLGDDYVYGGVYSPTDTSQGADCSGVVGWVLEALTNTPNNMSWAHVVSTESWPFDYGSNNPASPGTVGPYGTVAVAELSDIPADAALIIDIEHGGGGEYSHTNCSLQGTLIESNGDYGSCTNGNGAYAVGASLWTDHWYLPGPVVADQPGPAPEPAPRPSAVYRVQPGDTLSGIAEQYGVSLQDLENANPSITDPSLIFPGQDIHIP